MIVITMFVNILVVVFFLLIAITNLNLNNRFNIDLNVTIIPRLGQIIGLLLPESEHSLGAMCNVSPTV